MYLNSVIETDYSSCFNASNTKDLLRFITCGSVDDGKSTLIGRLLYESHMIYDDQLASLATDSKKFGTTDADLDFALLVDGLAAEREQGITIDVAYRFFSTSKRKFIVADTPGHEQYTRNMATGASTASLAIVMIDARKGILTQTRRHSYIVSMLGVKYIVLAINKMDLVHYDQAIYEQIKLDYHNFAKSLGIEEIQAIPISALTGDNIINLSPNLPWYQGPTLIQHLEKVPVESNNESKPFLMPVQWINRPNPDFRGFTGRVSSGTLTSGQRIKIMPGEKETEITRIVSYDGDLEHATAGQSITCILKDEIDISRGDVFTAVGSACQKSDQFETKLLWMSEQSMIAGHQYLIKIGTATALCYLSKLKYSIDMNTMAHLAAKELRLNEIGCCEIALDRVIAFEPYEVNRELGAFILIDRVTNATVASGMINFALRRSTNVSVQDLLVDKNMRSIIKEQKPFVIWLTGLSGAGKSSIANLVELQLNSLGRHTMLLDGDNIRHGLSGDLGFSETDRKENIRRIAEVAKLMTEAGLITLVSFISPFASERIMACDLIGRDSFVEIYVEASLEVAESRDTKGLYKKARLGEIKNFTGIDSPYEIPQSPDLVVDTVTLSPEAAAAKVMALLRTKIG